MKARKKKCRMCKEQFLPTTTTQIVCSPKCAYLYSQSKERFDNDFKAIKRKNRETDIKSAKRRARSKCHRFIHLRDHGRPCISCGNIGAYEWHAGHYWSGGNHPALRYDERNINIQCSKCNTHLSGNQAAYRKGLIERIGEAEVNCIDSIARLPKRWTVEELNDVHSYYAAKIKQIMLDKCRI